MITTYDKLNKPPLCLPLDECLSYINYINDDYVKEKITTFNENFIITAGSIMFTYI